VNSREDAEYRLRLARGFLKEAEENYQLQRWRSCVANAQLTVENGGKSVLMLFGITLKTDDPARHLAQFVHNTETPELIRGQIKNVLPEFLTLGAEEHFMTDYGDDTSYKLPWDIFTEVSADRALKAARS